MGFPLNQRNSMGFPLNQRNSMGFPLNQRNSIGAKILISYSCFKENCKLTNEVVLPKLVS